MDYTAPTDKELSVAAKRAAYSSRSVPAPLVLAVLTASYIGGGDGEKQQAAVREEGTRLLSLSDAASPETVQTLASHLPVLEAMFLSLAKEAVEATRPSEKVRLLKASLQAQESYGRTVALIAKLNKQTGVWDTVEEVSWRRSTITQN
jgi:hypothetical protein